MTPRGLRLRSVGSGDEDLHLPRPTPEFRRLAFEKKPGRPDRALVVVGPDIAAADDVTAAQEVQAISDGFRHAGIMRA